jgi:DNA ligase-associated metallophosphoesterase
MPRSGANHDSDAGGAAIWLNGVTLRADASGALVWPERRTVIVADLHLEKASSFARHGALLPPYDTKVTLARLGKVLERHRAERVLCLGDSFHDCGAEDRLAAADAALLARLVASCDWWWIAGNHDPAPPSRLGGRVLAEATLGALTFRHVAASGPVAGEVSGHFHPTARLRLAVGQLKGKCFVSDGRRLILPAFGAFTGGLDVLDPAITRLFPAEFHVHVLARGRIVTAPRSRLGRAAR